VLPLPSGAVLPPPGDDRNHRNRDQGDDDRNAESTEQPARADRRDRPDHEREAGTAEDGECHRPDCRNCSTIFLHCIFSCYSAQQESFAGSLYREIATIFSASAIVG